MAFSDFSSLFKLVDVSKASDVELAKALTSETLKFIEYKKEKLDTIS